MIKQLEVLNLKRLQTAQLMSPMKKPAPYYSDVLEKEMVPSEFDLLAWHEKNELIATCEKQMQDSEAELNGYLTEGYTVIAWSPLEHGVGLSLILYKPD